MHQVFEIFFNPISRWERNTEANHKNLFSYTEMTEKRYRTWRLLQIYSILTSANQAPSKEMEKVVLTSERKTLRQKISGKLCALECKEKNRKKGDGRLPTVTNALGWPTVNLKPLNFNSLVFITILIRKKMSTWL